MAATLVVSRHRGVSVISCTVLMSHSIVPTGSFLDRTHIEIQVIHFVFYLLCDTFADRGQLRGP